MRVSFNCALRISIRCVGGFVGTVVELIYNVEDLG